MMYRKDGSGLLFSAGLTLILLVGSGMVLAGDWPQFRGPNRDGISEETGLMVRWPESGPEVLWRTALGDGYSGISLAKKRIYTMFGKGADEFVVCLDAVSGEEIWRFRSDDQWKDTQGNGPRATPTVDGAFVYAVSANGKLYALAAKDGKQVWQHDLRKEYRAKIPRWGMSGSPLVEGNMLLVEVGANDALFVAFNKKNGKEIWRSEGGKAGYTAPLAFTSNGVRQVIFFAARAVYSVSPEDGAVHWKLPWKTDWDVNAAMPIFIPPDKLFISSGYNTGSALLRVKGGSGAVAVEEVWRNPEMKNQFSSSVLHGNHLYGFHNKILQCLDVKTGEMKWRMRDLGHGSLIYADGHLIVLGERGQLVLIEATPEEYREKGRVQIFRGKTWTLPTLSGGKLYLRDEKELLSLDIAG